MDMINNYRIIEQIDKDNLIIYFLTIYNKKLQLFKNSSDSFNFSGRVN